MGLQYKLVCLGFTRCNYELNYLVLTLEDYCEQKLLIIKPNKNGKKRSLLECDFVSHINL